MRDKLEDVLWNLIHKFNRHCGEALVHYTSKVSKNAQWAFISYIPESCYRKSEKFLNGHQNRREMKRIVKVFNDLGYNVYVSNYSTNKLPNINPSIVFGLEPCFEAACKRWPNALKIYYATGASYMHQNGMIKKRTDEFNRKYNPVPKMPYQRLTTETNRYELADYIFQIGSKFTIETYPEYLRGKIKLIRQSSTLFTSGEDSSLNLNKKNRKTFISLVANGLILKGLDLLIEYFRKHPEYKLHLAGNVDCDFWEAVGGKSDNIEYHGFINTSSEEFKRMAEESMFMIYPSCTEGGMPGAVINSMYFGCIPIVTRWASPSIESFDEYGFPIEELNVESITKSVEKAEALSNDELLTMCSKDHSFVKENYNLNVFESDLKHALTSVLK